MVRAISDDDHEVDYGLCAPTQGLAGQRSDKEFDRDGSRVQGRTRLPHGLSLRCDYQPQHDMRLVVAERRSLGVFAGRYFLGRGIDGRCCAQADLDLARLG